MTFKLAHLSDLHLQYRSTTKTNDQGINIREVDGYLALAKCVSEIIEERCDAVLVAGDIFHGPNPSIRAIVFAQKQFRKLADHGVKVYMLGGNHDTLDVKEDISAAKVLDDGFRGIYSTAEPYVKYEVADGIHLHLVSHHLYTLQQDTMKDVKPLSGEVNIFSTHGSVIDPLLKMKLHAEMSPREVVIPDSLIGNPDWNYVLLGHIHERGWVGSKDGKTDTSKKRIYYNGSTIRRGFSDKAVPLGRGWTLWEIESDGTLKGTPRQIPQRTQVDFKPIEAKDLAPEEITDIIVENLIASQGDTGKEFVPRVAPILRQTLVGLTPAKNSAIDWRRVKDHSQHALDWSIKKVTAAEKAKEDGDEKRVLSDEEILNHSDIVEAYDDWIKENDTYKSTPESIRETVAIQTRSFIQQGQESTLESE